MTTHVRPIRIQTYHWRQGLKLKHLEDIVQQINKRAQDKRMIGQIHGAGLFDGKTRLTHASHFVLPTARIQGSSIVVDIETLDNGPGNTVAAFFTSGLQVSGFLRALGSMPDLVQVISVDVDLSTTRPEETVLDDIVDALEASEE
jgi:hypothetical protein